MACTPHLATTDKIQAACASNPGPKMAASALLLYERATKMAARTTPNGHHLLKDIGITRERALLEARKWFWQD
jgi:hypothetical protein